MTEHFVKIFKRRLQLIKNLNALKVFKSLEPSKLSNLIALFAAALLFWTSITCLLPTLPAYIQDLGATAREVGLVMGCFAIGLLLSRIWLGKLADQRSRKLVVLIGSLVAGTAPIGYLLFDSLHHLMVIRAFHGISIAAFTTGYNALVVDLSPPKQKGELIGYMSLTVPIGMAVGPALGGFLQAYTGYKILFSVSASCGLLALLLANQVQEIERNLITQISQNLDLTPSRSFWQLFLTPALVIPTAVLLLIGSVFGTLVTFLPLYIRSLELDLNAGLFYSAAAIASFTVRFFTGRASDFYGRGVFISVSLVCYIVSMILLTLGESANIFLLAAVIEGMAGGIIIPIMLALIVDRCSARERGQVFAFCVSGFDIGVALAGPVLGGLASSLGYRFLFAIASAMAVTAFLLFTTFSNKNLASSLRFAFGGAADLYTFDQKK
jgi:MFS family permease